MTTAARGAGHRALSASTPRRQRTPAGRRKFNYDERSLEAGPRADLPHIDRAAAGASADCAHWLHDIARRAPPIPLHDRWLDRAGACAGWLHGRPRLRPARHGVAAGVQGVGALEARRAAARRQPIALVGVLWRPAAEPADRAGQRRQSDPGAGRGPVPPSPGDGRRGAGGVLARRGRQRGRGARTDQHQRHQAGHHGHAGLERQLDTRPVGRHAPRGRGG